MTGVTNASLPTSWLWVQASHVADVVTGNTPPTSNASNYGGEIPFVKPPQLVNTSISSAPETISSLGAAYARVLPVGAVLVSCIGNLGKTAILKVRAATNQQINALVFDSGVMPEFGFYYAQTMEPWLITAASATTVAIVNKGKFESAPFPLAPAAEQTRIVEKLEELLSALDAGVAELKAAQKKLMQYRQSLLKAAVEGALTTEWRKHSQPVESGAQLLERILKERRARWQAKQLAKFKEQGKSPPKDWQDKYPEPVKPDTSDLPPLPEGWVWASVDDLILEIETGKSFKCEERPPTESEVGVVKVSAVSWGEYDEAESKTCQDEARVDSELFVKPRDFLFSRANTIELVGACVLVRDTSLRVMLSDKILRFVFVDESLKWWLLWVLRSTFGREQIENLASGNQDSMRNIGQGQIRKICVPMPPASETTQLLSQLSHGFATISAQSLAIQHALKQSTAQRKNILQAAFSGQLVPQDPNDEPASVLLARIRAERASRAAAQSRPKVRRSKPQEHV